ncbi:MAG: hypothetical protein VB138_01480 [Burkholderia sp.]
MDRQIVYPGAIPLETDLLNTNKNAMIGLAKLAAAIMGTGTMLNGLACTPDSPASLNVKVAAGEIYSLQNIDGTAYSSLAADTAHSILKQGIMLDSVLLSCPAPATNGYSINYLVQVAYQDTDANAVVLPYYNASNPSQAYSGPNNAGTTNYTTRKGVCAVSVKAGVAATTGTQTTPAPDAGYTGIYSVTVAYGQTQITAGNINAVSGAPFINSTLLGLSPAFSVSPTVPTPTQFDNSQKAINAAFLKAAGMQASNFIVLGGNTTLTAAHVGATIATNYPSAQTWTLPLANSVSAGSRIEFACFGTGLVTIQRAGSDGIVSWSAAGSSSLSIGNGDVLTLASNGWTAWYVVGGTVRARVSAVSRSANLSLPASACTKVTYDTVEFDSPGFWDTTNQRFSAKFPGKYRISGAGLFENVPVGNFYHEIRKNGVATSCKRGSEMAGQATNMTAVFDAIFDLAVGDYLEIVVHNYSGATQTYGPGTNVGNYCYAQCEYLGQ